MNRSTKKGERYSSKEYDLLQNQLRRQIILYLDGLASEGSIGSYPYEISKEVRVNISTVYHHLRKLRECGVVTVKDAGYRKYYSLTVKGHSMAEEIREFEDKGIFRRKAGRRELEEQLRELRARRDELLKRLMMIGEEYKGIDLMQTSDTEDLDELYTKLSRELLSDLDEVKKTIRVIEQELYGKLSSSRYFQSKRATNLWRRGLA